MTKIWPIVLLMTVACGVSGARGVLTARSRPGALSPFSLREQSEDGLVLHYTSRPRPFTQARIDSIEHIVFSGPSFSEKTGDPELPADVVSVGVPPDSRIEAEFQNPVYLTEATRPIAPVPTYRRDVNEIAIPAYVKNSSTYSRAEYFPSRNLELGPTLRIRGQTVVAVRIASLQYNPVTGTVKRLVSADLKIRFIRTQAVSTAGRTGSHDMFDPLLKSLLVNYDQAKAWRSPPGPGLRILQSDSTRDWFTPGRMYVRIPVAADGWYRLGVNDLLPAGVAAGSMDWSSLELTARGKQLPFIVRLAPDSTIEFFAFRNYGDSTFFDFYTDTSTVWLTWGGTPGVRYQPVAQHGGAPAGTVRSSLTVKHFEQNNGFYIGTGDLEVGQNTPVPGRGWYWENYYPQVTTAHPFSLDSIDRGTFPTAAVTVRLFSITSPVASDGHDHKVKFWVNDSLAGQVYFAGRTGVTWTGQIPATWLNNGANTLTIRFDSSSSSASQFYLDWYEIQYGRFLTAQGNELRFSAVPQVPGLNAMTVSGFTSPLIEIYDPTGQRLISGGTVAGDSVQGYSVTFNDTLSGIRTYVAVASPGRLPVLPLSGKMFADIRANPQGADCIVITHRNFLSQAQQLAAHRTSFNGVRPAVIDVQDIYDEFNFGIMNAEVIRDFLRYAYQNWPGNKPSTVLMFGGASWDFHHYLPTTVKNNFVPAYGVPAGDNWFVCFNSSPDSVYFPSMLIGRLPVKDVAEAQATVSKVIGYDTQPLGNWNKNFLFITGGDTPDEQSSFDFLSDNSIQTFINGPPIGGTAFRVYKTGPAVIDGSNKQYIKDLVRGGLVLINFLGHSGGALWGVDIGPPAQLENTNGQLPFVVSVSCNVGAFAEPSRNVLAEDFLLAPNRGAIATWASGALGYPFEGMELLNLLMEAATVDSIRDFGTLTTLARIRLWQETHNAIARSDLNLTPLLGDPLTRLIIPRAPDNAVGSGDITLNKASPTPVDTALTLGVVLHNYGLVPNDSLSIQLSDLYNGATSLISGSTRVPPTLHRDSISVPWDAADKPGRHVVTVNIDPLGAIQEVDRSNNIASTDIYVYANALVALKPLRNQVVPPGIRTLVVSNPLGSDSTGFQYFFEADTAATFDSPSKISSGPVQPGYVWGQWSTPPLQAGRVFYWRARTVLGSTLGRWVYSSFATSSVVPAIPRVRLREYDPQQFDQEELVQAARTDSGVVIAPRAPLFLYARSVGYRYNQTQEFYSLIRLNDVVALGYWWHLGSSFMVMRVDEFTGAFTFQAFDVVSQPSLADSMRNFILNTPSGNYLAFSVIFDGSTNVTDSLKATITSLGSTMIGAVTPGQSWALIARKGYPSTALEQLSNDTAGVSVQIPDYFSFRIGWMTSAAMPVPDTWHTLHWSTGMVPGKTDARLSFLGIRQNGRVDTLRSYPADSTDVDISSLSALTANPLYESFRVSIMLTTNDALVTPVLKEWSLELEPPGDLAISKQTIGLKAFTADKGTTVSLPVSVFNIGYRPMDSATVSVQFYDRQNVLRPLSATSIAGIMPDQYQPSYVPINTSYLSGTVPLHITVAPLKGKELSSDNNVADVSLTVTANESSSIQLFADGAQLLDGDYIAPNATLLVKLPPLSGPTPGSAQVSLYVDNTLASISPGVTSGVQKKITAVQGDPVFDLSLADGRHDLSVHIAQPNLLGGVDSLQRSLSVNVISDARVLQVLNYPNPFSRETSFTFILTGARTPDEVVIRVFTVAGRKIREIPVAQSALRIGFNRVVWDGRDNDGDDIANGYYLYQVQVRMAGKTDSVIGKLAKVR